MNNEGYSNILDSFGKRTGNFIKFKNNSPYLVKYNGECSEEEYYRDIAKKIRDTNKIHIVDLFGLTGTEYPDELNVDLKDLLKTVGSIYKDRIDKAIEKHNYSDEMKAFIEMITPALVLVFGSENFPYIEKAFENCKIYNISEDLFMAPYIAREIAEEYASPNIYFKKRKNNKKEYDRT